jgi:2-amino-4-hydroxy-6-hydroxymethyldihydropteridine diphosphokinase
LAIVYLGFGSNLGNREGNVREALRLLKESGIGIDRMSSLIETDPVGGPPQGKFLNAAARINTQKSPEELLSTITAIEKTLGRVRREHNGPRTIDIDILLYDDLHMQTPQLTIPHPRMWQREFVLEPLREIAPELLQRMPHAHR